jgi:hypothetical protein
VKEVHIYFWSNHKAFPLEIQFWTRTDALLSFYTHEMVYKQTHNPDHMRYALDLRKWLYNAPHEPNGIELSFIDYLYEIVYATLGE